MIIRNGFVTNSSSTNYIILSNEELTPESLAKKLGVNEDSPIYYEVLSLCRNIVHNQVGFRHNEGLSMEESVLKFFGKKTLKRYKKAKKKNHFVYYGYLRDDDGDGTLTTAVVVDCYYRDEKDLYIDFSDWAI